MMMKCELCGGELLPVIIGDNAISYTCKKCKQEHDLNGKLV